MKLNIEKAVVDVNVDHASKQLVIRFNHETSKEQRANALAFIETALQKHINGLNSQLSNMRASQGRDYFGYYRLKKVSLVKDSKEPIAFEMHHDSNDLGSTHLHPDALKDALVDAVKQPEKAKESDASSFASRVQRNGTPAHGRA